MIEVIRPNSWRLNKDHLIFTHGLSSQQSPCLALFIIESMYSMSPSPPSHLRASQARTRNAAIPLVLYQGHADTMANGINLIPRAVWALNSVSASHCICLCKELQPDKRSPIDNVCIWEDILLSGFQ